MIIINKYLNDNSILTHFCMLYVTILERAAFNLHGRDANFETMK